MAVSGRHFYKTILIVALAFLSCVANAEISTLVGANRRYLEEKPAEKPPAGDKPAAEAPAGDKPAAGANATAAAGPAAAKANGTAAAGPAAAAAGPAAANGTAANGTAAAGPAAAGAVDASGATVFDVLKNGGVADGKADNAQALVKTWKAACESTTQSKVLIPEGKFMSSPATFQGPCKNKVIFELVGTLEANTDLAKYPGKEWMFFEHVDGLTIQGKGTFDGKGESAWQFNECKKSGYKTCNGLPSNLKFGFVTNGLITGITSLNSKYFHLHITDSGTITISGITITAPGDSPNTDGIHVSNSKTVNITDCVIGSGDDCVSVGQGVTGLRVTKVTCGPGHGISVGSLGKYKDEEDVSDIIVSNCTLKGTTNGARVKSYGGSPPSLASNIVFEDLILDNVKNPIIIDQHYGNTPDAPSQVKISDVHFRNIKGTTASDIGVSFLCSSTTPCDKVELSGIEMTYTGDKPAPAGLTSECVNAVVAATTTPPPLSCTKK